MNKLNELLILEGASETAHISLDHRDFSEEAEKQFKNALKSLGLTMYRLPSHRGTDAFGFLISKRKLSTKEIKDLDVTL